MDKEENKEDVTEDSSNSPKEEAPVEGGEAKGNDKDNNLAALRKSKQTLEEENEKLRIALSQKEESDRSLSLGNDDEERKEEKKPVKKDDSDTLGKVFERDMREATYQWNKTNKVSSEEWAKVKSKVQLKGDETVSEIKDKIEEAYQSLPEVRQKRDKELIEKGKKLAMQNFTDEELDNGGGGDIDFGSGESTPRYNAKTRGFARGLGLSEKDLKEIDQDEDPNEWKNGPNPTRKAFQP